MLKKIIFFLLISTFFLGKSQETAVDLLSIPNPIELNGTEFYISWSKQSSKTLIRQQYLPKDESIENFNQILDWSFFTKEIEMESAVRQKVESIQKREENDKFAKVNVTENPDGSEFIVDYYISGSSEKGEEYVEYSIDRFKTIVSGADKKFLILNYGKRIYGDAKSAAKSLSRERDQLMSAMIEFKIPDLKTPVNPGK